MLLEKALGLLLLALVGVSNGLGASKCSWGPNYWCRNIRQASECRAVRHCIQTVWEQQTVPKDDDEVCRICKEMVTEARDTLQSNDTQEELKEVFEGSCNLIPLKIVAKECVSLVDEFIPELVETLASQMNPDVVCSVSGLCNSARIDRLLAQREEKVSKGLLSGCEICHYATSAIERGVQGMTDFQIEEKLAEMCGKMDSYSDACFYTVGTESQSLIRILREHVSPSVCAYVDNCPAQLPQQQLTVIPPHDDLQCEFCEKVVKHWIETYASNASIEEFREMMEGICDKLDKNNAAHCKYIVDQYYVPAFEFIRRVNPKWVCSTVGLCPMRGTIPTKNNKRKELPAARLAPAVQRLDSNPSEKPTCVICEYVLHQLQTYLKDDTTEEEIKEYVEGICTKLPTAVRSECDKFVEEYEPLLVSILVDKLDPNEACKQMKLCDQSTLKAPLRGKAQCETCEFVLNEVFSVLNDKDDRLMVKNVLESVCYRLPATIDQPCEQFVDKYTDTILDMIAKRLTPDEICAALDMCESSVKAVAHVAPEAPVKDTACVLCEYVISNLDAIIEDKKNEAQIKEALESVCSIMPATVKKDCVKFVESYTDMIIDLLTHDVTPKQICSSIGLCKEVIDIYLPVIDQDSRAGPYCTLCQFAIGQVDQMVKDKQNEDEIKKVLDSVCYYLSAPVHKECLKMVDKYTDEIIQMILNDYTPELVCKNLALCVDNLVTSNDLADIIFTVDDTEIDQDLDASQDSKIGCVMCEFAMEVLDEHMADQPTVEQIERTVQFLCSYLPGSVADKCEEFVDKYGQKIIDAIVKDRLNPKEVCTIELGLCDGYPVQQLPGLDIVGNCPFGEEMWCASPLHARMCGAIPYCQRTAWRKLTKGF